MDPRLIYYRRILAAPDDLMTHHLRYRVNPWEWVIMPGARFRKRLISAFILNGKIKVGALELLEFQLPLYVSNDDLLALMDLDCGRDASLSEVLVRNWYSFTCEIAPEGSLIEFRTAWVRPDYRGGAEWCQLALGLIAEEMSDHAIMLLQACPLEYDNEQGRAAEVAPARSDRLQAMQRYYHRQLGAIPFDGTDGRRGWMYRVNPAFASPAVFAPSLQDKNL